MTGRALINKRDVWFFLGLAALAVIFYAARPSGYGAEPAARIAVDGRAVKTVGLSEDGEFPLSENPNVHFAVRDGAIGFIRSDCRDGICIRGGFLSRPGQMAACLPNRVSLVVTGSGGADGADATAR